MSLSGRERAEGSLPSFVVFGHTSHSTNKQIESTPNSLVFTDPTISLPITERDEYEPQLIDSQALQSVERNRD